MKAVSPALASAFASQPASQPASQLASRASKLPQLRFVWLAASLRCDRIIQIQTLNYIYVSFLELSQAVRYVGLKFQSFAWLLVLPSSAWLARGLAWPSMLPGPAEHCLAWARLAWAWSALAWPRLGWPAGFASPGQAWPSRARSGPALALPRLVWPGPALAGLALLRLSWPGLA